MANIGTWAVNIIARTGKFDRNVKRSRRNVQELNSTLGVAKSMLKGFGIALGTAAAAGALNFLKSGLDVVDQLGKTSRMLGITTKELQILQHAATLSGVDLKTLENGLKRLEVNSSEAARGIGEARDAFEFLGVSANELVEMTPFERFREVSRAINGIENSADRAAMAQRLFGRSGVDMMNLFSAGIGQITKEFQNMGGLELQTDEIEELNDTLSRTGTTLKIFGQQMLTEMAPALKEAAQGLQIIVEWMTKGARAAKTISSGLKSIPRVMTGGTVLPNRRQLMTAQAEAFAFVAAPPQNAPRSNFARRMQGETPDQFRQSMFRFPEQLPDSYFERWYNRDGTGRPMQLLPGVDG